MALVSFQEKSDKDGQLMLSYASGDASAFEILYRKHKDALYRFFLRQCGNRATAEELYQELWMRVIRARRSYEQKALFRTWLYRIAHNLLVDHLRKPVMESDGEDESGLENIPANASNDPEVVLDGQEKIERFRAHLHSLPREQLEVFLLKEEAGLSLNEIAETTGESFETVKSRLRYAVKKLKEFLQTDADENRVVTN